MSATGISMQEVSLRTSIVAGRWRDKEPLRGGEL